MHNCQQTPFTKHENKPPRQEIVRSISPLSSSFTKLIIDRAGDIIPKPSVLFHNVLCEYREYQKKKLANPKHGQKVNYQCSACRHTQFASFAIIELETYGAFF